MRCITGMFNRLAYVPCDDSAHNPENWAHHAATELRALLDRLIRENAGRLFHPGACAACLGTFCGGGKGVLASPL